MAGKTVTSHAQNQRLPTDGIVAKVAASVRLRAESQAETHQAVVGEGEHTAAE